MWCTAAWRWICCCRGSSPARTDTTPDGEKSDRQTSSQTHRLSPNTPLESMKRKITIKFTALSFCQSWTKLTCAVVLRAVPHSSNADAKNTQQVSCTLTNLFPHKYTHSPNTASLLEHMSLWVWCSMVYTRALGHSDARSIVKNETWGKGNIQPTVRGIHLIWDQLVGLNTIWTVAAIQTVEVGSKALCLKCTGGRTATNAVSVYKTLIAAIIYTHGPKDIHLSVT